MANNKKFYWIKLKTDFFNIDEIDFLLSQKNGCEYIVLYQMICLKTANNGGRLCTEIGEMIIPFDIDKIVRETKYFDFDTVAVALELFKKLGLVYEQEDNILKVTAINEMVGSETASAQRVRKHRENKALQCNNDETTKMLHCNIEKENREKSIDIENIDIDKENKKDKRKETIRHKYGEYKNVLLSDEDLEKLKTEFPKDYNQRIDNLSCYMASTGKSYKNHLATIRNWARKENKKAEQHNTNKNESATNRFSDLKMGDML